MYFYKKRLFKIILIILFLIFLFIFLHLLVKQQEKDDTFSIKQTPYKGELIRTDGFYYTLDDSHITEVSFFYENGIFLNIGGMSPNFLETENFIYNNFILEEMHKRSKVGWGLFYTSENKIFIETWLLSSRPHHAYVLEGTIIDSSSFRIEKMYRLIDGFKVNSFDVDILYYFREFNYIPSYENDFIK